MTSLAPTLTQAQNFPYLPTRLFAASKGNQPFVYVLNPPSSTSTSGNVLAIDISSTFDPAHPPSTTLATTLPFLHGDRSIAITTSLDPNGALNVLAGDCTQGAAGASLWTFTPERKGRQLSGAWARQSIDSKATSATASQVGVNYLAASVSFAATSKQNASVYTFAGMCPFQNSTDADWMTSAGYSNQLLILDHDQPSEYDFKLGSGRGQPVSEAGFSITPLEPSYSNASDGSTAMSQNFLLLGGHTQEAFINMSQVALFSLPQASWTFLPVSDDGSNGDLKSRQAAQETDPRSGHTAVLSADGSKVVMFGGWVGDTATPADPQLAVLEVGAGYGGAGDWNWAASPTQATLSNGASGIYGHGAAMLDGDVMLVMGGFTIPAEAKTAKRDASPPVNSQNLMFNITSGKWIDSYVPPPPTEGSSSAERGGLLATRPQKVGLGVGLTFGILAIVIAAIVGWLISKRFKEQLRAREEEELREKEIEDLHRFNTPYDAGATHYGNATSYQRPGAIWDGRSPSGGQFDPEPNVWRNDSVREAERSGMDLDIPSPQRGLRKSMASRQMHSGRGVDDRRISRGSGVIHPIEETEEEESPVPHATPGSELEDPFKDPEPQTSKSAELGGRTEGDRTEPADPAAPLTPAEERTRETAQWVNEWFGSVSSRNQSGRVSPDRSERTESNLSDRSSISQLTARTHASSSSSSNNSHPVSTPSPEHPLFPPNSRRSLRILPAAFNPFAGGSNSTISPTSDGRSRGSITPSVQPPNTGDSFRTAPSTFATLQSESDALLGPARPGQARFQGPPTPKHGEPYDPLAPDDEPTFVLGHRNEAHKAPTGKVGSILGSVRRAVANAGRSASLTSTGAANANRQRAMAQAGPSGDGLGGLQVYDMAGRSDDSPASSPTKKGGVTRAYLSAEEDDGEELGRGKGKERVEMRRSASEGAASFLSKKQGAKDWGWQGDDGGGSPSDLSEGGDEGMGKERSKSLVTGMRPAWKDPEGDEDDWDVEKAVGERNIQVMFSVPKERLRVVNTDVDALSLASGRSTSGGKHDPYEEDPGLHRARSRDT